MIKTKSKSGIKAKVKPLKRAGKKSRTVGTTSRAKPKTKSSAAKRTVSRAKPKATKKIGVKR